MIPFDPQRVLVNVRKSDTQDLLNRVTAYRDGMEPEAITIIERELHDRGVTATEIQDHADRIGKDAIFLQDGIAAKCTYCYEPAVAEHWGWHRLFGWLPLFPRRFFYCRDHQPQRKVKAPAQDD